MKDGNGRTTLTSLAELKGIDAGWAPKLALPSVELGDIKDLEKKALAIIAEADKAREWVRSILGRLEELRGKKREVRELVADQVAKAEKELVALFNHELPAYRRAAWLGLLEHEFSRKLNSRPEVEELLGRLVKEGRLIEDPAAGDLKAYGKAYSVAPASCFEELEIREAKKCLIALMSRVFQETGKVREEKAVQLRPAGTITLEELVAGQPGTCAVEMPSEEVPASGTRPGFWRGGGTLLVESDGQVIRPLDAAGAIEHAVAEAARLKVFLLTSALQLAYPPTVKALPKEMADKIKLLWYMIRRAHQAKKMAEIREAWASRATINVREFFLEGKQGICLAEFQGTWQNQDDGSTGPTNLFFLVEREEAGTKKIKIKIVDVPDHLRTFFAPCMDEYVEEGNKYKGLPYPLIAVLQAVYGQVLKASQDAEKAGQIAG